MPTIKLSLDKDKRYLVAVSGGVDSMMLLDLIRNNVPKTNIVAAYFNHAVRIRAETDADWTLIRQYCEQHEIASVTGTRLAGGASEAELRSLRYEFLERQRVELNCDYIVTAHHADDVVETAIINLLRGTKSRGLSSLRSRGKILRPLIETTKQEILKYANDHAIIWHEDSTNQDTTLLRNYVRHNLVPKLKAADSFESFRSLLIENGNIEAEGRLLSRALRSSLENGNQSIDRHQFILLPHAVSLRIMRDLFERFAPTAELNATIINKAVVFAKTARNGATMDISKHSKIEVGQKVIKFLN